MDKKTALAVSLFAIAISLITSAMDFFTRNLKSECLVVLGFIFLVFGAVLIIFTIKIFKTRKKRENEIF